MQNQQFDPSAPTAVRAAVALDVLPALEALLRALDYPLASQVYAALITFRQEVERAADRALKGMGPTRRASRIGEIMSARCELLAFRMYGAPGLWHLTSEGIWEVAKVD